MVLDGFSRKQREEPAVGALVAPCVQSDQKRKERKLGGKRLGGLAWVT
jgi:hypothetical protein